jgi:tetratricopeptide (TPR) repeat protein
VVSRDNVRELRGSISVPDILAAYGIGQVREEAVSPGGAARPTQNPTRLLVGVLAALILVAVLAGSLNYYYRGERANRAEQAYRAGNELMRKERYDEAIERFRNALSISHSAEHRLALGLALIEAASLNEAEIYLNEVLRSAPESGPAHLGLGRIYEQEGRVDKAIQHYQRAIDGAWPDKAEDNRQRARSELSKLTKQP